MRPVHLGQVFPEFKQRGGTKMLWNSNSFKAMIQLRQLKKMTKIITVHNPEAVSLYSDYLAYRCQKTLYQLWSTETVLSWEKFIAALRGSGKMRSIAKAVIQKALLSFDIGAYDFELKGQVSFFKEDMSEEVIYACPIFSKQEGEFFVHLFMLQTEMAHQTYLMRKRGQKYRWKQYIKEVIQDDSLHIKLIRAYQKALTDLDFEGCWRLEQKTDNNFV